MIFSLEDRSNEMKNFFFSFNRTQIFFENIIKIIIFKKRKHQKNILYLFEIVSILLIQKWNWKRVRNWLDDLDIIVCIHADKSSVIIGLRNFVMPLRASSFPQDELPTIIFVTDPSHIEKEWDKLSTFPDIYILNVSHFSNDLSNWNLMSFLGFSKQSFSFEINFYWSLSSMCDHVCIRSRKSR